MHPQVHATEHDQEGPEGNAAKESCTREGGGAVQGQVEPNVPGDVDAEEGVVGGETPVLALLEGHHRGNRGAWQAQQVLQKPYQRDTVKELQGTQLSS